MSRKEVVLLVSRALAMIQLITALLDISYLPEKFMSFNHYTRVANIMADSDRGEYYQYYLNYDRVGLALLFARIAALLLFAFLFWNCGPTIERILLPKNKDQEQPN
ncbi:MAG: hypothetical protein ABR991_05950 [Terracidiphilus sp.]|jgi:hypothetical protein